jgi:sugar transferase (PEP-CTERM/EpsH1 system associated)
MAQSIRVLHVLHSFSAGGLENGLVNIINGSPDHIQHELCTLTRNGNFVRRLIKPVVCHELHKQEGNDFRLILKLRRLFRNQRVDVIHTRNWAAFDGVLAACLTPGIKLVHGEHGRDISDPRGTSQHRNLARRVLSFRARKYVAVSQDLYGWLQQTVRIPSRKLEFIPNGVDTNRFRPGDESELRSELGIEANAFVIGSIGRMDPVKNHEGIVRAVAQLASGKRQVHLVIVGDGPNQGNLESVIRNTPMPHKPHLLGYRPDVERIYRMFDLFILNSFAEGMSNTVLEAMASGLPAVCTSVGGNSELIQHRQTGMLIDSSNDAALTAAIAECMDSPEECARWGRNARQYVIDEMSLPRMISRYVPLYESVA